LSICPDLQIGKSQTATKSSMIEKFSLVFSAP
jgi:hypothetical protein